MMIFHSYVKLPEGWEDGGEDGFWEKKHENIPKKTRCLMVFGTCVLQVFKMRQKVLEFRLCFEKN